MKAISKPWFEFKGVRNTEIGVLMVNMPIRQQPVIQGDKTTIKGRDGFLFVPSNSYGSITISQDIVVPDAHNLPRVLAWLNGRGDLSFFDSAGYAYDAMILTAFKRQNVAKRLEGEKMTIQWTCQPFKHAVNDADISFTSNGAFSGMGDVSAKPIIKVEGNGSAELGINGNVFTLSLVSGEPLYLDCDAGVAYVIDDGVRYFAGNNVSINDGSDWYELNPKGYVNRISSMSGISKVTITPRWRWF